jgi:hypothetical protein
VEEDVEEDVETDDEAGWTWYSVRRRIVRARRSPEGIRRMVSRIAALVLVGTLIAGSTVLAGPAQDVLGDLARTARSARVASGVVSLGVGVAVGVGSVVFLAGSGLELYGALAGALIAVSGIVTLVVPSPAEPAFEEAGESEPEAALALERLATAGRQERLVSGVLNIAAGVAALLYPINLFTSYDSIYSAVSSFGMAAIDFLLPSTEERAYATYQRLVEQAT